MQILKEEGIMSWNGPQSKLKVNIQSVEILREEGIVSWNSHPIQTECQHTDCGNVEGGRNCELE